MAHDAPVGGAGTAVVVLAALAGICAGSSAPIPGSAASAVQFSARSELVVLYVGVTDKSGAYVTGLDVDAFSVFEDGRREAIGFFGAEDSPVTVGLLIDSSGSMAAARDRVGAAVAAFAETSNPQDEIFALAFNDTVHDAPPRSAPFTADPVVLRRALFGAVAARGRTALHDGIAAGLDYLARGTHPRKVLVVVSDGGDNASTATFEEILSRTQSSNTVIYTIALTDSLERDANPKRLRQLAEATGGQAFRPGDVGRVGDVLRHIAREIGHTYTIGYVPANTARDGRWRRLRVVVTSREHRSIRVRTRQGYVLAER